MNFELTAAQEKIVRQVQSLCTRFPDEYWRERDARVRFPRDFFDAIAAAEYLGVAIPEKYGGSGLGITEAALILLDVAAPGAAMAGASSIHLSIFGVSPLVFHAAWLFDNERPCGAEANIAKLRAADAGFEACDRAVQTLGGYGYIRDYDVERYFRECRLTKIAPVSQEMAFNSLTEHALGLPRSY